MKWLRNRIMRWLHGQPATEPVGHGAAHGLLPLIATPDNPAAIYVVGIRNGFLLCRRTYNPNGPDAIDATFAGTVDELSVALVNTLATQRLTQK